jgi:DNA-binding NarL/FixJ family response regulator
LSGERESSTDASTGSPIEQEVLAHLADGASNQDIAETLNISPKTVARHRENIMHKLNLHSRSDR